MRTPLGLLTLAAIVALPSTIVPAAGRQTRPLVLENVRVIDGTGAPPVERGRLVIEGDRIAGVGPMEKVPMPADADTIDLMGRTVIPGLIDLHFHIENDPKLALRQLSHGVTSFRDPGQWDEKFEGLRQMVAAEDLPGPRIFTTGPHIDGERPAYPADAVVARDPAEARRFAENAIDRGATALKIYFRLPLASARAVIDVCEVRHVPCTAHLELLDARELIASGLRGVEHITSFGVSVLPPMEAARLIDRRCWPTTTRGVTEDMPCSRRPISMVQTHRRSIAFFGSEVLGSIPLSRSSNAAPTTVRPARHQPRERSRSPALPR